MSQAGFGWKYHQKKLKLRGPGNIYWPHLRVMGNPVATLRIESVNLWQLRFSDPPEGSVGNRSNRRPTANVRHRFDTGLTHSALSSTTHRVMSCYVKMFPVGQRHVLLAGIRAFAVTSVFEIGFISLESHLQPHLRIYTLDPIENPLCCAWTNHQSVLELQVTGSFV